jgi:hypothetical protein
MSVVLLLIVLVETLKSVSNSSVLEAMLNDADVPPTNAIR